MTRDMTPEMSAALTAALVRPLLLVELSFRTATVNICNARGPIAWDGKTWEGYGALLSIGGVEESSDGRASQAIMTLSGVLSEYVALAYADEYQGREARIWLAAMADDGTIIDAPIPMVFGLMDAISDADDGTKATLALTIVTQTMDQRRARFWRLTDAHQQELFSGDKGLEFVAGLVSKKIKFGG